MDSDITGMVAVDLNADVGEECGDDAAVLAVISTANVAAGAHAGGGDVLVETVRLAAENRVRVGAHPSYRDRENFGRASFRGMITDVVDDLVNQIVEVAEVGHAHGVTLSHVKAHGALYNDAGVHEDVARAVLMAAERATGVLLERGLLPVEVACLPVMGQPGSVMHEVAVERGIMFWREGFADRAYLDDGRLMPRSELGAVLHDPTVVAARAVEMVITGTVVAASGARIDMPVDTLCLHGDTPEAAEMARQCRAALLAAGVSVRAL